MPSTITQERLKVVLDYDRDTGIFRWHPRALLEPGAAQFNAQFANQEAGNPDKAGYRKIVIDGERYPAHALAVLFETGRLPAKGMEVDHINRDPKDNRWCNLRVVTPSDNKLNRSNTRSSRPKLRPVMERVLGRNPTQDRLKELLDYDPDAGEVSWKWRTGDDPQTIKWNARHAGKRPGSWEGKGSGRKHNVTLDKRTYTIGRILWMMMTGEWPHQSVEVVDGNWSNLCWNNLKLKPLSGERVQALQDLTKDYLLSRFHYDRAAGQLSWREIPVRTPHDKTFNRRYAGKPVGSLNGAGYLTVNLGGSVTTGSQQRVHILIWIIEYGSSPQGVIDHVDQNRTNNRIENLRDAGRAINAFNQVNPGRGASGVRGVSAHPTKPGVWQARIRIGGRNRILGSFETVEIASHAYREEFRKQTGHYPKEGRSDSVETSDAFPPDDSMRAPAVDRGDVEQK